MTGRTSKVIEMTEEERGAFLARLGRLYPEVFDEIYADTETQRTIRERREGRTDGREA